MDCPKPACSLLSPQCTATLKSPWCTWENLWMARSKVTCKANRPLASAGLFSVNRLCLFGVQGGVLPITIHTHQEKCRHFYYSWTNHREEECVRTVINMFLYQRGSVHFYSLAAGLFYLQDRGTLFNFEHLHEILCLL